jgi:hypothetical protein
LAPAPEAWDGTEDVGDQSQDGVIGAIAEIQRRSLDAASALVDRLVAVVDGARDGDQPGEDEDVPSGGRPPERSGELMDTWAMLLRESVSSLSAAGERREPLAAFDVGAEDRRPPVVVSADPTTGVGSIEVWVHNPTADEVLDLRLDLGAPRSSEGKELSTGAVSFDPAAFGLPARSSRGITLRVDAAGGAAGTYRAVLQVDGLEGPWLAVEIRIPAAEP